MTVTRNSITCPCCGQTTAVPWVWDFASGVLSTHLGATAPLNPRETLLLDALIQRRGGVLSRHECVDVLYGERDGPDNPWANISVAIHYLRRKLAPIGVRIAMRPRIGYRLVLPAASSFREAAE
ncbi:winged helix-turn-helix domain-containing protein [Xanthobacter versatilis]|uniref:winged helix-turn-helix domain-containing protein n=1 Tax=Xanthobacter autotrophicus (strain ATCC BAA-1158 / Py2) TaxID=78245 RepID=UPI003726846D